MMGNLHSTDLIKDTSKKEENEKNSREMYITLTGRAKGRNKIVRAMEGPG